GVVAAREKGARRQGALRVRDHRDAGDARGDQAGFVGELAAAVKERGAEASARDAVGTEDPALAARAAGTIAAREHGGAVAARLEPAGEGDDDRGLAGAAGDEVADRDGTPREADLGEDPPVIEGGAGIGREAVGGSDRRGERGKGRRLALGRQ